MIILFILFMFIYITDGLAVYILFVQLRILYILTFFVHIFFRGAGWHHCTHAGFATKSR